ncbi:hypothetical protein XM38_008060 [Halomicronema hongdechloris C2206]|uniref:Uncharacterized protein n=1 Tax=Halomicronema hongdechloris C2206 TaxID=1641165 RepID=A0A1Z3HHV4_9CYAN|nr:hypothetical protein XM38_008060 [Halomicronema hongdechloris C2206]
MLGLPTLQFLGEGFRERENPAINALSHAKFALYPLTPLRLRSGHRFLPKWAKGEPDPSKTTPNMR